MTKNLNALFSGQLVSQIGDQMYLLALSYWVMATTKSAGQMGIVLAAATATGVVCRLFSGSLSDRWNRRTILIVTDIVRGAIVAAVGLAMHFHVLTVPMVALSQILVAAPGALFTTTLPAIIPELVRDEHLSRANARMAFINAFSTIVGPILGGLLVSQLSYELVVQANAASFLVAAGSSCFMTYRHRGRVSQSSVVTDLRDGYAYVFSNRALVRLVATIVVLHLFVGSLEVTVPVLGAALDGSYAANLGLLQTALGVGGVCAGFVLGLMSIRRRELRTLLSSVLGVGVAWIAVGTLTGLGVSARWPHAVLLVVVSGLLVLADSSFQTYLQASVEHSMMGRVFGVMTACGASTVAVSTLCFGGVLERFALTTPLLVVGFLTSLSAIIFLGSTVSETRRLQTTAS